MPSPAIALLVSALNQANQCLIEPLFLQQHDQREQFNISGFDFKPRGKRQHSSFFHLTEKCPSPDALRAANYSPLWRLQPSRYPQAAKLCQDWACQDSWSSSLFHWGLSR